MISINANNCGFHPGLHDAILFHIQRVDGVYLRGSLAYASHIESALGAARYRIAYVLDSRMKPDRMEVRDADTEPCWAKSSTSPLLPIAMNRSLYVGINAIEAPAHIKRALVMRADLNPYGEPLYRLVRTEGRKRMSLGKWHDWAPNTARADRNPDLNRAWKSVVEKRPVPLYPGEHGWVLEKWMPMERWGTPEVWNLPVEMGGTFRILDGEYLPSQGGFPYRGDYEGTGYLFPNEAVSEAIVLNAVGRIERLGDGLPKDPRDRVRMSVAMAEEEERRKQAEADRLCMEMLEDENPFAVQSLGARAEVCRLAESIGIRSHPF